MSLTIPTLQIRQQPARIGIETERGLLEMKQPKADVSIETRPSQLEMNYEDGILEIDQSRAWDALSLGGNLEMNHRIYSQSKDLVLRGIARIVENGNRMAAIHLGGSPIADIAMEESRAVNELVYPGEASMDNVDIKYTERKPEIRYTPASVSIEVKQHAPEYHYNPTVVNLYMLQRNSLEFIPPEIDYKW